MVLKKVVRQIVSEKVEDGLKEDSLKELKMVLKYVEEGLEKG